MRNLIMVSACLGVVMATQVRADERPSDARLVGTFDAWLEGCKPNALPMYRAEVLEYNKLSDIGDEAFKRAHYKAKHNAARMLEDQNQIVLQCNLMRAWLNGWSMEF